MFYLIGLGLKPKQLTLEALEAIRYCDEVFLENYTSVYAEGNIFELEKICGKKTKIAERTFVEEEFEKILENSRAKNIALLVLGNPLSATTHIQAILDAKNLKIDFKIIPGISVFDFLGATGLQQYKFGRTTTIVLHEKGFEPESFYDVICENQKMGLHTLCLLDIKAEQNKLMTIKEALDVLEKIESNRKEKILQKSFFVGFSNAFSENEKIFAGTLNELKKHDFGIPASLIVCGKLNEKEKEALGI